MAEMNVARQAIAAKERSVTELEERLAAAAAKEATRQQELQARGGACAGPGAVPAVRPETCPV